MRRLEAVSGMPAGMSRRSFIRRVRGHRPFLREWGGGAYAGIKDLAIGWALDNPALLKRFRAGRGLPRGYGFALDERIVELPWVLAMTPAGHILDAGSALNQRVMLERLVPNVESLTVTTFAPESEELAYPDVDYVAADLRDLPFADGEFETVVSVSTLEHVGMDNSDYGSDEPRSDDPDRDLRLAVGELRRVLKPGGRLLVTVPYGRPEDHGWLRQFDAAGLGRLIGWFEPDRQWFSVYRHSRRGWQRSSLRRAAGSHYRDHREEPIPGPDCTLAAEAVACFELGRG